MDKAKSNIVYRVTEHTYHKDRENKLKLKSSYTFPSAYINKEDVIELMRDRHYRWLEAISNEAYLEKKNVYLHTLEEIEILTKPESMYKYKGNSDE